MAGKKPSSTTGASRPRRWFRRVLFWSALGLLGALGVGLGVTYSILARDADSFLTLFALRVPKTITKVLDRNGDVIGVFAEQQRVVIPYGDIPKAFTGALVATEDADFWNHGGISTRGILRGAFNFVVSFGRRKEGASTLTMQLVRSVTERRDRRIFGGFTKRKLKEMIIAQKLERAYTKKQILESYANEVYFGGGRYGIEAAAQFYFGKSAPQLNVEECAVLAGLVQNPNWYNPYNPEAKARAATKARRNHVLRRMVAEGYLKDSDALVLAERPIRLARENAAEDQVAPYAVEEVRKYLYEKYGRDRVLEGGLEVHTTLDSVWQEAANEAVRNGVRAADRRRGFRKDILQSVQDPDHVQLPGWRRYFIEGDGVQGVILGWSGGKAKVRIGAKTLEVPESAFGWAGRKPENLLPRGSAPLFIVKEADDGAPRRVELDQDPEVEGALLATDPRTGEIRAMVGGFNYNKSKFNRAWQSERQVGSTMKLFVYATAFLQGRSPATMVNDTPTRIVDPQQFSVTDLGGGKFEYHSLHPSAKLYEPRNYEPGFLGPIPIWEAIRESRNIPAVRTLDDIGATHAVETARKMGITGSVPPYPSMALGAADLMLKDLLRAYSTVCDDGHLAPAPFLIRKIVDRNGKVLEVHEASTPGDEVLDPATNFQVLQCLQGVVQRGTAAKIGGEIQWPLAGKTGTTNDHTDAWFVGFSTRVACGVWVGLDAKKTIYKGADGAKAAVPVWIDFMKVALQSTVKEDFTPPQGLEWVDIDRVTGLRASGITKDADRIKLAFKPGQAPKEESDADAVQRVSDAKVRANTQGYETRIWGVGRPKEDPPPDPNWGKVQDPNG